MKSTFSILSYLKKGSERKDGRAMIMARITIDGKVARSSTKQSVLPAWRSEKSKVKMRVK